jgi:hypothetical protein
MQSSTFCVIPNWNFVMIFGHLEADDTGDAESHSAA